MAALSRATDIRVLVVIVFSLGLAELQGLGRTEIHANVSCFAQRTPNLSTDPEGIAQ
jgi:hypothetical protein